MCEFEPDGYSFGDGLTHTYSEKFSVHLERALFEYNVSLSETEPEPQGGDYLSAERRRTLKKW